MGEQYRGVVIQKKGTGGIRVSTGEYFDDVMDAVKADLEKGLGVRADKIFKLVEPKILENFFQLMKEFERYLRDGVEKIMISTGVPPKSDILDTLDVSYGKDLFQLLAEDYYQYLSKGRKPKARKVPIHALIQWIKDKSIPYKGSINSAAFAIQQAIFKFGIAGKNYEEAVIDFTIQAISEYSAIYLQDTSILNILTPFWNFQNNEFIAIGVRYGEIHKKT